MNGLYIPSVLGLGNHRWFPVLFYNTDREDEFTRKYFSGISPRQRAKEIASKASELDSCLENTCYQHWIISSEHLQSRLLDVSELMRLRNFIKDRFRDIRIIIYLRDPLATALASWSTSVISGGTTKSLPPPRMMKHNCDHSAILGRWTTVFGSKITIRKYARNALLNQSVVDDFAQTVRIDTAGLVLDSATANESLSQLALMVLSRVNSKIPPYLENGMVNMHRKNISSFVRTKLRSFPRYTPTIDEFNSYREYFYSSDISVAHKYFESEAILWASSYQDFLEEMNLLPTERSDGGGDQVMVLSDIISQLWIEKQEAFSDKSFTPE
jgi:hypothetical protein